MIIGASARAAAFSAYRAGFDPCWIDEFGDQDLAAAFPGAAVAPADYPAGIIEKLKAIPVMPWLYTGAVENHTHLFGDISRTHPLLGNNRDVCQSVRDPEKLGKCLKSAGIVFPETLHSAADITTDKAYLLKPARSGGGLGISIYTGGDTVPPGYVLQERVEGDSRSAVFIGNGERAVLAGVTRQLVGVKEFNAATFAYCGSIGPLTLDRKVREQWNQIGTALVKEFGLLGLFGVDAVCDNGKIIPVEVNPRYTASVEVVELAMGVPLIEYHVRACRGQLPERMPMPEKLCGKAVLFAPCDFEIGRDLYASKDNIAGDSTRLADIPPRGAGIKNGHPLLTLLAGGGTQEECLRTLVNGAGTIFDLLLSPHNADRAAHYM